MVEPQPTALTTWLHPPYCLHDILSADISLRLVYLLKNFQLYFMSNLTHFTLNGYTYFTEYKVTIFELISYFNYNSSLLVLEYNNLICRKKNWDKIIIKNNDRIEIVTIVGGG